MNGDDVVAVAIVVKKLVGGGRAVGSGRCMS